MEMKKECELIENKKSCFVNKYGDGVAWFRGAMIGKGSFGSVFLANLKKPRSKFRCFPSVMAVKSAEVSVSGSIQKEREVLVNIGKCNHVIRCFGDETTTGENGEMVYNLLLEYGSGGSLADLIKKLGGGGLPESDVKRFTRSVLRGIDHIHESGYVHCDLKPDNILLMGNGGSSCSEFRAKIGDLGLAKRCKQSKKRKLDPYCRGTPMYLSPEAASDNVQEYPSDIWALGCIVLEMLTGKPPWERKQELDGEELLGWIADGNEIPKIPSGTSIEAKKFLKGCLVRNPMYRWTAEMLMNHPFLEGVIDDDDEDGEFEEVSEVNMSSSLMLVSDPDDEGSFSSFSDYCSFVSEEESFCYLSDEEMDGEEVTNCANGTVKVQESGDTTNLRGDSEFNNAVNRSLPSNARQHYPIAFTIPAGV